VEIKKWLGLRNTVGPEAIRPGGLERALDVDIDDAGAIRTRRGRMLVTATPSHSLYDSGILTLLMQGLDLKRFVPPSTITTLRRLTSPEPLVYAERNGVVYFTNGIDTGRIVQGVAAEWGVRVPTGNPAAAPTDGYLPVGRYLYALAYVRRDGLESGASAPSVIELTEPGGIAFSNIPTSSDPDVTHRALYISAPNGTELYMAAVFTASEGSYSYRNAGLEGGVVMDPDYVAPAPAGTVLEVHAGCLLVASGSTVWISDQYAFERFRQRHRFFAFPGEVTMMASVTDGLYVGTDKATYYLGGNDPAGMKSARVADHGATPGTAARMDVSLEATEEEQASSTVVAALWMSPEGVILGMPGGAIRNLTSGDFNVPAGVRGAALLRSSRGYTSYVTTVQGETALPNAF
jgi:hypothetical protein